MFADSHCHLNDSRFDKDLDQVLQRAHQAGVVFVTTVATRLTETEGLIRMAEAHDNVTISAGIHPHHADEASPRFMTELFHALEHPRMVAVGETGLDFHYDHSPRNSQKRVFREHIRVATARQLPLIVHTREAEEDTIRILEEEGGQSVGGVIHCFSGSMALAQWALAAGFHISFSGILTFRGSESLRQIATAVPLNRLLIETDAPYLAPIPFRGKRNEPARVVEVARVLADVKGISLEELAHETTSNYRNLFRLETLVAQGETLVYVIGRGIYVNLTHGCTLRCSFCPKWERPVVHQYDLTLRRNPKAEEIIAALGDVSSYDELVFCGFGEPTLRLPVLLAVAHWARGRGCPRIRINTDGLANRVHGRDVTPSFSGIIDAVSISLNAQNETVYDSLCHPSMPGSYGAVKEFCHAVKRHVPEVVVTAVEGLAGVDIEACRQIAREELGVSFRKRLLNQVG
ncbi:MAG: YchF/TatD family DNA exonuclease [Magnetococcales bacterium]|nr:YchF/TatD family DNA exonuclease [Magnetococcales bacterium]